MTGSGAEAQFTFTSSAKAALPEINTPADIPSAVGAGTDAAPDAPTSAAG